MAAPEGQLDLSFEAVYPQARERVWAALTESRALAAWLLDNDFEARVGHRFVLRGPDVGEITCAVAVLEPPQRMEWLWSLPGCAAPTRVTFLLDAVEGGTKLTVRHHGPARREHRAAFARGWPLKLASLDRCLAVSPNEYDLDLHVRQRLAEARRDGARRASIAGVARPSRVLRLAGLLRSRAGSALARIGGRRSAPDLRPAPGGHRMTAVTVHSKEREQVIDVTDRVAALAASMTDGVCIAFTAHTTCALTILTNEDGIAADLLTVLHGLVPQAATYVHDSADHVRAHVLSALVGPSVSVPVHGGRLGLGEFQRIVLLEFEGPRERTIQVSPCR